MCTEALHYCTANTSTSRRSADTNLVPYFSDMISAVGGTHAEPPKISKISEGWHAVQTSLRIWAAAASSSNVEWLRYIYLVYLSMARVRVNILGSIVIIGCLGRLSTVSRVNFLGAKRTQGTCLASPAFTVDTIALHTIPRHPSDLRCSALGCSIARSIPIIQNSQ